MGTAVSQVYFAELASVVRTDPARALGLFRRASVGLAAAAAILALVLVTAGPVLFTAVFGSEWRMSGRFAQGLALALAAQVVAVPLSQTLVALERQGLQLAWDSTRLVAVALAIWLPEQSRCFGR